MKPKLRLVPGGGQLPLWTSPETALDRAIPLARELRMMADIVGPASRGVADELLDILEGPRKPRRVA